jgi:hemolysin III
MEPAPPRLRGWLHGATVPFALAGLWLLCAQVRPLPPLQRLPALGYGLALVGLFTTSAAYHVHRRWSAAARGRLLRLDGAATVLLIVGTFLPVAAYALDGGWRRASLIGAAVVAVTGVVMASGPLTLPPRLAAGAYVLAGWLAVIPMWRLAQVLPGSALLLLVAGGLLYSAGAAVFALRRPDPDPAWFGYHEVFHVLVVTAAAVHYAAVAGHVIPLAT